MKGNKVNNLDYISYDKPDQRVRSNKKKHADWYIPNANYLIDLATALNDKTDTIKFINAANGIIDDETYSYVLKNYVKELGEKGELYGTIREVDFLTPIKERYMGEFINMFSNYQVLNNDASIVLARNKALANKVMSWVNQEVINKVNEQGIPTNQQSKSQKSLDKVLEDALEEWSDNVVINGQQRLELINSIINAKDVYLQAYYYWWSCQECYTYRYVHEDEIYVEAISPLEAYPINIGHKYMEDGEGFVRKYMMSIEDVITRFRDRLKPSEIQYLKELNNLGKNYTPDRGIELIKNLEDFGVRNSVLRTTKQSLYNVTIKNTDIEIVHYQWKTEVPEGILTHYDVFGNEVESRVDETYKLDKEAGDIEIKWIWTLQTWEGFRIGGVHEGIYLPPEPLDVQREKFNNTADVKLGYNGVKGLMKEDIRNPIPYRVQPFMALYRIYTLQQERAIARFKSYLLLPESILGDSTEMTTEERMALAYKDGTLPVDDADSNPQAMQYFREIANQTVIPYIEALERLKERLKADAFEVANMNSARLGDTKDYAGKAVTQMNYDSAITGSVWSLEVFNLFREIDYKANLDYSKFAWIDGKQGAYIDPNTNEVVVVDINGTSDWSDNLSVSIRNNTEVNNKLRQMQDLAFSAAQNDNIEIAIDAINNNNINQLSRNIKKAIEAKREYEQSLMQIEQEGRANVEQIIAEREAKKQEFDGYQKQADRDNELLIEQIKVESNERIWEKRLQIDIDGNGYIDREETAMRQAGYTPEDVTATKLRKELKR